MPNIRNHLFLMATACALSQSCGKEKADQQPPARSRGEGEQQGKDSGMTSEWIPTAQAFEQALSTFSSWTPVLPGDAAFKSEGHGGIWVRSYLDPTTVAHVEGNENPYPLPQSSLLAKAVVSGPDTQAAQATRVYFMRKERPGFDPAGGDWSYGVATRVNGQLILDPNVTPTFGVCVSCHVKFKAFDNVKTVDTYRKSRAN
jgi:hypothetical protein